MLKSESESELEMYHFYLSIFIWFTHHYNSFQPTHALAKVFFFHQLRMCKCALYLSVMRIKCEYSDDVIHWRHTLRPMIWYDMKCYMFSSKLMIHEHIVPWVNIIYNMLVCEMTIKIKSLEEDVIGIQFIKMH